MLSHTKSTPAAPQHPCQPAGLQADLAAAAW